MAIELSKLVTQLQSDVAARNGVPSNDQYTEAVKDAVWAYSDRLPLKKSFELSVVSGTATYSLPSDFLRLISLLDVPTQDGVMSTDDGLIPIGGSWSEKHTIAGQEITFQPTPAYTATRWLWYTAAYILDEADIYMAMTADVKRIVMLKAQAIALGLQADKAAQEAWQYTAGAEKVSKEKLANSLGERAERSDTLYEAAIQKRIGPVGKRA